MTTSKRGTWFANVFVFAYIAVLFSILVAANNGTLPHPQVAFGIVLAVPTIDLITRPWRGVPFNLARRQH